MKIFFVLPVFNDHVSLAKLIQDLRNILHQATLQFIIVDDASTNKLNTLADMRGIHYIKLKSNKGNQKAIFIGMNYLNELNVEYDYLIVMDSDGEDRPQDVPKLIEQSKMCLEILLTQ